MIYYVYKDWMDDEILDRIFSIFYHKELPIKLWELMKEADANYYKYLLNRLEYSNTNTVIRKPIKIPYSILADWIDEEEHYFNYYDRILNSIFNEGHRQRTWIKGKYIDSIIIWSLDEGETLVNNWINVQNDWYGEYRGYVFQDRRLYNFYSRSLDKWVKVRQFLTSGKHVGVKV